jgi:serine/threonine protein kinase
LAKLLLVDDDSGLRNLLQQWLAAEDYQITPAETGLGAWQALQSQQFDVVILDWDLPDLKGIDLLRMYRSGGGDAPILLLTGRDEVDDKSLGLDSGADDYLTKPFHPKELSSRLRAILRRFEGKKSIPKPLSGSDPVLLRKANLTGTTLASHYELLALLGEGATGIVFKARNPHLDKFVAIKMLDAQLLNDEVQARFEREARAASRLDHPNIATVFDFGVTENNQRYMVMEYVEGRDLADVILDQDFLSLPVALNIAIQICDAMAHAHKKGVLHRDLKPSNVMLKEAGDHTLAVKILDFGLAKLIDNNSIETAALTKLGEVFGSPLYMSPEQVHCEPTDERSDIYSFGCIVYELFTGYPPLLGKSAAEVLYKHIKEKPPSFQEMRPDLPIPASAEKIVARALEKDKEKRYQSMSDFKVELKALLSEIGS